MKYFLMILASPFVAIWQGVNNRERDKRIKQVEKYRDYRQDLFNCLSDLGTLPTSSEMDEVERIVKKGLGL